MKLTEIKVNLIEQFFVDSSNGVLVTEINPIFESLGKIVEVDVLSLINNSHHSNDPSKAFKRFTEGRLAILTINEEDGINNNVIFAAVRFGRKVAVADLTKTSITEKISDLATVKSALRQSKNLNDDAFFNISIKD